jgi:hypothetical protein
LRSIKASDTTTYSLTPTVTGAYATLPQPNTTYVSTGCSGQPSGAPDARFPANLANGPYQITKYVPYNDNHNTYGGGCEFYGAYVGPTVQARRCGVCRADQAGRGGSGEWVRR